MERFGARTSGVEGRLLFNLVDIFATNCSAKDVSDRYYFPISIWQGSDSLITSLLGITPYITASAVKHSGQSGE
jgi:hypothetical protein